MFLVTDAVSTPPALDLVSRSYESVSAVGHLLLGQMRTAVYNSTARLLGLLRVSVPAAHIAVRGPI